MTKARFANPTYGEYLHGLWRLRTRGTAKARTISARANKGYAVVGSAAPRQA